MGTEGIVVKPNGKFMARIRVGGGKRVAKTFDSLADAQYWIEEQKRGNFFNEDMTVNKWFIFWENSLIGDVRDNTRLSYKSKYNTWISPMLGTRKISEIRPYNCMEVFNNMRSKGRKQSSIDQVRIVMRLIFDSAVENEVITSNPVTKSTKMNGEVLKFSDARFLTRNEQRIFLEEAKKHKHYEAFAFILQTGIRYGELTGLKWSDINFESRLLHIERQAYYIEDCGDFVIGPPKSAKGYRDIYLTDEALAILSRLSRQSEFIFADKNGEAVHRSTYNTQLKRICKIIHIEPFSIHKLRHTFATRCIESGMKPKTLQKILGHSDVTITLNYYVHITDNELAIEMAKFEALAI